MIHSNFAGNVCYLLDQSYDSIQVHSLKAIKMICGSVESSLNDICTFSWSEKLAYKENVILKGAHGDREIQVCILHKIGL